MKVGYARVSTKDQSLDMQLQALEANNCERLFKEKISGKGTIQPQLQECLNFLREGDTLVVYKLDRLGRSLKNILALLDELNSRGVTFISLQDNLSTEGANAQLMINLLGTFAQFERDLIVERCQEGRKVAKAKGVKFGRLAGKVNKLNEGKVDTCVQLYQLGKSIDSIMQILDIGSKETVYHYLRKKGIKPNRGRGRVGNSK